MADVPQILCVGAVAYDGERLLLVRRRNPPGAGLWSIPGGKVEPGESPEDAVVREVAEETGLRVRVEGYAGRVTRDAPDGTVFVIDDYTVVLAEGCSSHEARAASDALEIGWFDDLAGLDLVEGLVEALDAWGLLRR